MKKMTDELAHFYAGDIQAAKVTEAPRSNSATGYGRKLPTPYMLQTRGPSPVWRRVYVVNYGNAGSSYVSVKGKMHFLSPGAELIIETIRDGGTIDDARRAMDQWPEWMKTGERLSDPGAARYEVWTFEPHGSKPPAYVLGGLTRADLSRHMSREDLDAGMATLQYAAYFSFRDTTGRYCQIRRANPPAPAPADIPVFPSPEGH